MIDVSDNSYKNIINTSVVTTDEKNDQYESIPVSLSSSLPFSSISFRPLSSFNSPMHNMASPNIQIYKSDDYSSQIDPLLESISNYEKDLMTYNEYPYFIEQPKLKFTPTLSKPSSILSQRQIKELHNHLPYYEQYKNWSLEYVMSKDGTSINTFYSKSQGKGSSLLVVKDDGGNVFGAYANEEFKYTPNKFYGTGETFLFSFFKSERVYCFLSTGENENYIYSDDERVAFGCSDDSFSLSIGKDFWKGYSTSTKTFKNPSLTLSEGFSIVNIELYSFQGNN